MASLEEHTIQIQDLYKITSEQATALNALKEYIEEMEANKKALSQDVPIVPKYIGDLYVYNSPIYSDDTWQIGYLFRGVDSNGAVVKGIVTSESFDIDDTSTYTTDLSYLP